MNLAEFIAQLRWRPQIGDPTFMGWLTVVAYGAAAVLCLAAALRGPVDQGAREARARRRVWLGVAVLMIFLCVNKQFDLQSLITDIGRTLARQEGWYGQRRAVQRLFVLAVAATGFLTIGILAWKMRTAVRRHLALFLGLGLLLTFIVIRAASFHHVDALIRSRILGVRVNWILELSGIGLIALGAVRSGRKRLTNENEA